MTAHDGNSASVFSGTGKRAVLYARVSTDEQAEKGYSLQTQFDAMREYATRRGMTVVAEIQDDYSGARLDRPGLDRVREKIDQREVDAVIVYTADRLSRNLAHSIILREEWQKARIELHYVDRGQAQDTAESRLTQNIEAVIAEYEREKIRERTRRGKNRKAEVKRPVMTGHPPYGYKREGKGAEARLFIYELEAQVVRLIFEWYVYGEEGSGPFSLNAIAEKLSQRGEPTPNNRRNAAHYWITATIRGILTNEIYVGQTYYGKTRFEKVYGKSKRVKQPREKWIAIPVPDLAIVDRVLFSAAQRRLTRNIELSRRNRKHQYLLSGYFRCGECSSAMAGAFSRHKGYESMIYRCGNHWRKPEQRKCPNVTRTIATHIVDEAVWSWLSDLLSDDQNLNRGLDRMAKKRTGQLKPKRERLALVQELIAKAERRVSLLARDLRELDSETGREAIRAEIRNASKQLDALSAERDLLMVELGQGEITQQIREEIKQLAKELREELADAGSDFEAKRRLLDLLDVRVIFQRDQEGRWLDVTCAISKRRVIRLHPSSASSPR